MTIAIDLREQALAWLAADLDEHDKAELTALLADESPEATAELAGRFARQLRFGPDGLHGPAGAGPSRMNRTTVTAVSAAVARWLLGHEPGAAEAGVVLGCDAAPRSAEFTAQAARIFAGAGIRVHLMPGGLPAPFPAFAVRFFSAAAGVMITDGHGGAGDSSYRVYAADGAPLVPPADTDIQAAMTALGPLPEIATAPPDSSLIIRHGDEAAQAYLDSICATGGRAPQSAAWLRFAYTPLDGSACALALRAFEQAGYAAPDVVAARFADPAQPGALDLAIAQARRSACDLVLATDADGSRLAVAVPDPDAPGGYRQLTADQIGALLGAFLLGRMAAEPGVVMSQQLVVSTVVCGSLLSKIAAAAGAQHAQTLSGFQWLVRAADLRQDVRFAFGYAEDLGFAVGGPVRDADSTSAALAVLGLAAVARSVGESLQDAYDALEVAHGVHLSSRLIVPTHAVIDVMSRLRAAGPAELAGQPVIQLTDYTGGSWELPSADMISYQLPEARVVIRPGKTQPEIEAYLEVVEQVAGRTLVDARLAAGVRMERLRIAVGDLLG
ncbi:MAG TPA: phospho-sugar mutase [Streptosporangiaceae bacterium]|nr:phospho-sugar mutase [Streptosporangiaceae bacterium]